MLRGLMGKIIPIAYIDLKRCFGENWRRIFFASYLRQFKVILLKIETNASFCLINTVAADG